MRDATALLRRGLGGRADERAGGRGPPGLGSADAGARAAAALGLELCLLGLAVVVGDEEDGEEEGGDSQAETDAEADDARLVVGAAIRRVGGCGGASRGVGVCLDLNGAGLR